MGIRDRDQGFAVKGTSVTIKRGTLIKNIRLTNNPEQIECNADKVKGLVLKTRFEKAQPSLFAQDKAVDQYADDGGDEVASWWRQNKPHLRGDKLHRDPDEQAERVRGQCARFIRALPEQTAKRSARWPRPM